jgi:hypothetical protein
MNAPHRRFVSVVLTVCFSLASMPVAHAKASAWKDAQGASFRGEPTGILGPFAVFRIGRDKARRVPLRAFSPEDCLRLHAEISARPPRAASLAEAKGEATAQLPGNVLQVRDGKLESADLTGRPEPELLMVLAGSHNSGEGWFMAGNLNHFYHRVQRLYPGLVEGVFLGVRHDDNQHRNIAINAGMPWLVADMGSQGSLRMINRYLPKEGANAMLLTREGVPLLGSQAGDIGGVRTFVDQAAELLWQIDPANPAGWADRRHYLNATRPVEFARARAEPVLIGDVLRPEVLRQYGVKRVVARLAVAADGTVTPGLLTEQCEMPADMAEPLREALSHAVVAPAIDRGRPVPGSLDYQLVVPPADPFRDNERMWFGTSAYPVLPINEWLVLRPIKVSEQDFESSIVGKRADGTVILNALEVNSGKVSRKAQMSAFNTDWFAETGPGGVRPKAGDRQRIDQDTVLTWEKVRSVDGFVNMQSGTARDYTVGYAWAEFESPRDTEAWLGLGSDDGVKIWLNGKLVHDQWVRRPSRIDDEIVPLRLNKGANRLLIKIQNATDQWSFTYRLRLKP